MKLFRKLLGVAAVAIVAMTGAQSTLAAPQPFSIPAQGGPIRITPIYHASLQIEYGGKVIQVDPFSQGNYSKAKKADLILITHTHADHLDLKAIEKIRKVEADVIMPLTTADAVLKRVGTRSLLYENTIPTQNANRESYGYANIEAVPAYNIVRGPKPGQKFHPKGQFNGYVLTLGGKRIYIAGDTEATPEMKKLKKIDVAFLPMNLPFTMTPQEAAAGARAFKPKMAVPYHYRYPFDKPNSNPQQFAAALRGSGIKVLLLDWYSK